MYSLLEKLHRKTQLSTLLLADDKRYGRRVEQSQRVDLNNGIVVSRGVELKSKAGVTVRAGGKIQA